MPSASISLGASTASAAAARRFARTTLDDAGLDVDVAEQVELLVSELVTNAVLHTGSGPRVTIDLRPDDIKITVEDDSPQLPTVNNEPKDAIGGRGMLLVDRLAARWGAERADGGKLVWFVVLR